MLPYTGHRGICPQIVALSVMAGKCAAPPMHRVRRHSIATMFCYQVVYNMPGNMRPCAWKEARHIVVAPFLADMYLDTEYWSGRNSGSVRSLALTPLSPLLNIHRDYGVDKVL